MLDRLRAGPSDKTGERTVQTADRVIASCGCEEVGRLVSAECKKLVTLALAFQRQETRFSLSPGWTFIPILYMIVLQIGSQGDGNPTEWKKVEHFYKFSKLLSHA